MMQSVALSPPTPSGAPPKRFPSRAGLNCIPTDTDNHSQTESDSLQQEGMDTISGAATSRIRPVATEDAIGGDVPPNGFVLRTVLPHGDFCGRYVLSGQQLAML